MSHLTIRMRERISDAHRELSGGTVTELWESWLADNAPLRLAWATASVGDRTQLKHSFLCGVRACEEVMRAVGKAGG